jgi:hypothetical protein
MAKIPKGEYMKKVLRSICLCSGVLCLFTPSVLIAGNGFMGGSGTVIVEEESTIVSSEIPEDVDGPLNDKISDSGKLFGDLYKILRYQGGETKLIPEVNDKLNPVCRDNEEVVVCAEDTKQFLVEAIAVGGEPALSVEYAKYVREVTETTYELAEAPYPSQCVQPVADYNKWGKINDNDNRLPLIMTYDATWQRTECEVGELVSLELDENTGILTYDINEYFVPPCQDIENNPAECTWNGTIYCDGVRWAELVDEVNFGRLNLSRSPEAVLQAAYDEAINAINRADVISRDAAGRLLLTTNIYEEFNTGETCEALLVKTVTKAIDSPLENLALYVKLMKDGHLVTPGDERMPIDRSEQGGIPLWKMLELSDGPSDALRPTIDISKLSVYSNLVDVNKVDYYTYYECYDADGDATPSCLCEDYNPDGEPIMTACPEVVSRTLKAVEICPVDTTCEGSPFTGILTDGPYAPSDKDFDFAAAFLAAAADKTGEIGVDMVVYINSILGINHVIGYSEYDDDGSPADGAINYSNFPVYFDYTSAPPYTRESTVRGRGNAGKVKVLQGSCSAGWTETDVEMYDSITFHNQSPVEIGNIQGFTQMADDNLSIISFIHTYQIPGLR